MAAGKTGPWWKRVPWWGWAVAVVVLVVVGAISNAASGGRSTATGPTASPKASQESAAEVTPAAEETEAAEDAGEDRAPVEWEDYDPSVKVRIDELTAAADCAGLQAEFDTADANSAATLNRTGHSNANLMAYIDESLRIAGCY